MSSLILQSRRIASVFIVCASFATAFRAQQPKFLAPHHPVAPSLPRHREWDKPAVPQSLTGGLWMMDGNTKANAYLSNMLKEDSLTVLPILHLGNGTAYPLAPVTLEPSGTATIDINQALASQGIAPYATLSGYIEVQYKWGWEVICGNVWNVDVAHSLIFVYSMASPPNPAAQPLQDAGANAPSRQTLEGAWWKQDANVTAFVAVSNLTGRAVPATVQVLDGDNQEIGRHEATVSPHGTKIVSLNELLSASATSGGLVVTYEGSQDELVVNAGLQDAAAGYSARLPLGVPPDASAKIEESTRAELGLMFGPSDPMMNFPSGVVFTPYTIARNLSEQPLSVTPALWWMQGGAAQSALLPAFTLAPHQTQRLDMPALLASAGLANFSGNVNLVLDSKGPEGALLLAAGSVDKTNTYVFEVVPRGVAKSASKGLSYWNTPNGNDTMVTLWNPAYEEQDLVFTLFYTGGHYALPIHLAARATRTFNVSEITHNSIPDAEGNIVPAGIHEGSAEIAGALGENQHILIAMDSGIYNVRKATCGTYYCATCNSIVQVFVTDDPFAVAVGGSKQETFGYEYNTGAQYDVTSTSNWSSSNTSIATVSAGLTSGIAVGQVNISAIYPYQEPQFETPCQWNSMPSCPTVYIVPGGSGGGNVPATPTNFRQTGTSDAGNGVLHFDYQWDSTSGHLTDLANCIVSEKVIYPGDNPYSLSPPFPSTSFVNPTVLSVPGTDGVAIDNHGLNGKTGSDFIKPYFVASFTAQQTYSYTCGSGSTAISKTLLGPLALERAVSENANGTWKFTVAKPTDGLAKIDPLP